MVQICYALVFWHHICKKGREMARTGARCSQSKCMPSLYPTIRGPSMISIGVEDEKKELVGRLTLVNN
jgi:hypothetical protein